MSSLTSTPAAPQFSILNHAVNLLISSWVMWLRTIDSSKCSAALIIFEEDYFKNFLNILLSEEYISICLMHALYFQIDTCEPWLDFVHNLILI